MQVRNHVAYENYRLLDSQDSGPQARQELSGQTGMMTHEIDSVLRVIRVSIVGGAGLVKLYGAGSSSAPRRRG